MESPGILAVSGEACLSSEVERLLQDVITARIPAPQHARIDVFAPKVVVWSYEGPPQSALRALLNLHPSSGPHQCLPSSTRPSCTEGLRPHSSAPRWWRWYAS